MLLTWARMLRILYSGAFGPRLGTKYTSTAPTRAAAMPAACVSTTSAKSLSRMMTSGPTAAHTALAAPRRKFIGCLLTLGVSQYDRTVRPEDSGNHGCVAPRRPGLPAVGHGRRERPRRPRGRLSPPPAVTLPAPTA